MDFFSGGEGLVDPDADSGVGRSGQSKVDGCGFVADEGCLGDEVYSSVSLGCGRFDGGDGGDHAQANRDQTEEGAEHGPGKARCCQGEAGGDGIGGYGARTGGVAVIGGVATDGGVAVTGGVGGVAVIGGVATDGGLG